MDRKTRLSVLSSSIASSAAESPSIYYSFSSNTSVLDQTLEPEIEETSGQVDTTNETTMEGGLPSISQHPSAKAKKRLSMASTPRHQAGKRANLAQDENDPLAANKDFPESRELKSAKSITFSEVNRLIEYEEENEIQVMEMQGFNETSDDNSNSGSVIFVEDAAVAKKTAIESGTAGTTETVAVPLVTVPVEEENPKSKTKRVSLLPRRETISARFCENQERKMIAQKAETKPKHTRMTLAPRLVDKNKEEEWNSQPIAMNPFDVEPLKVVDEALFESKQSTSLKNRRSLHPAALRPNKAAPSSTKLNPLRTTMTTRRISIGSGKTIATRRSGSTTAKDKKVVSTANVAGASRKSTMPLKVPTSAPTTNRGIQKKPDPVDLRCNYCHKSFAIKKALQNHLFERCEKIPPKDRKKLLEGAHQLEEGISRVVKLGSGAYKAVASPNASDASTASETMTKSSTSDFAMPRKKPLRSARKRYAHSGINLTPSKTITCEGCRIQFNDCVAYAVHMTAVHSSDSSASEM